ncbi:MAG: branched-chain amino acid ABC transporter permease [archaeon]|jgi:branched-chain amino acid transport system permease protein
MIEAYLIHLAILIGIYLILALALQINIGFTGQFNLGIIAFFAIGAYTSALLTLNGFPFLFGIIMAGIISMIFGFILAIPTNKLKGDYLALATLGFSFVVYAILLNWVELTRGPLGLPGIPKPEIFGFVFKDNLLFLILTIIIAVISYFVVKRITNSEFGSVLAAIRDDELMAKILGKNTEKVKMYSLGASAFFAGIAGSLYASYITFIDPSSFSFLQIIPILLIIVVGGIASLRGTLVATIIIILLPEPLRFIGFPSSIIGPMRQIIYALILLIILVYFPKGLFGKIKLK